jgi:hypothetical protein
MARLLLTAENFAFGPICKLLFVVERLTSLNSKHELIFAGFGTSLQLAKKFPFSKIYEIDTDNPNSQTELQNIIQNSDIVISSMDLPSVIIAKKFNKPVVWIDCLFWFWDSIFEPVLDVDLYIRELSMNDSSNETKFGPKIKNLVNVGPILGQINQKTRINQALVSYGGSEATHWYKIGRDTNYPFVLTNILINFVDLEHFDQVIITSNEKVVNELKKKFKNSLFQFSCLPHNQFLTELSRSKILLTTAGLVTTESAFEAKTPILFLPSSNNSHYLLLEELRNRGLAPASVELSDYFPKLSLRNKPEEKSIAEVMYQLRILEKSPEIQKEVGTEITNLINNFQSWSDKSIIEGKKFVESLGGNGAEVTARKIEQLIIEKGV